MSLVGKELKEEKIYLEKVKKLTLSNIEKHKQSNEELNDNITSEQKELWSNIRNMDEHEIEFANTMMEKKFLEAKYFYQKLKKLEIIYQSPYFGRINFNKEKIYIGLSSVSDHNYKNYVYDWRAPISSLYYDYELGNAQYQAPEGLIKGNIDLKRQYKIENSKLEYVFNSSLNIQDEMLKKALSNNASEKMKEIVTTIQKEQNQVIRNTEYNNLIVEGAAGSGKTSVALHRIAFILYRYREFVNNNNIIIFSPNKVFSNYIEDVLPSLGEEKVDTILFSEFLEPQIHEYEDVENYSQIIERYHNTPNLLEKRILEIKMSNNFKNIIDKYIDKIIKNIKFQDIIIDDEVLITKEECQEDYNKTYSRFKPFVRIEKIINNVSSKYKNTHIKRKPTYITKIKKQLVYEKDINKIMLNMYYDIDILNLIEETFHINKKDFQDFSLRELNSTSLKYYDGIIYLYLTAKLNGLNYNKKIKYVVVDEAQDYNLMQYYLIKEYYKDAKFTILGDPNQSITSMVNYSDMKSIEQVINKDTKLLKLLTTYRSSYEITEFCNKILNLNHINMINRHSKKPQLIEITTETLKEKIESLINESIKEKFDSIAILCKNKETQLKLEKLLLDIKSDKKIYILPIYSSKGLEFDSVIVYDDGFSLTDKKLYYVACTRALHKLNILKKRI